MKNPLKKQKTPRRHVRNKSSDVKVNRYVSPRKKDRGESVNKRKNAKRKRLAGKVLLMGLVIILFITFLWINSRVTEVNLVIEQDNYKQTIQQHLSRNPAASYKPFISAQAISDDLMSQYPEIETVSVEMPFFGKTLVVNIVERQAQLVLQTADDEYFIVDRNGFAYDNYDPSIENDKVVILKDDTEVTYDLESNRFVPSAIVTFIEDADESLKQLKQFKNQTLSYRITDEARVIYIKPSNKPYEIKMQLDRPPQEQVSSLSDALIFYTSKGVNPVKYVDVRINGTVYYK